jgi:prepilin-type N-terminal cleavage/methylation domain-containing protein
MIRKMHRRMSNEKAFTLIEVIVSLVLIGIMAAIAGMGLVKIAEGYVFAKKNAETVQKVQIAIARIVKELGAAEKDPNVANSTAIKTPGAKSVEYTRPASSGSTTFTTNIIDLSSSTVTVKVGNASAATLIDNVKASDSSLVYRDAAGAETAILANIKRIDITLTVSGANDQTFKNTVNIQESY